MQGPQPEAFSGNISASQISVCHLDATLQTGSAVFDLKVCGGHRVHAKLAFSLDTRFLSTSMTFAQKVSDKPPFLPSEWHQQLLQNPAQDIKVAPSIAAS